MKLVQIILWSIVALLLIGLLVLGLTGNLDLKSININFSGCSIGNSFSYPNSELYSVGEGSARPSEVSDIKIRWVSGDVNIRRYDGSTITFSESSAYQLEEKDRMRYYINNGTLIIQFCAPRRFDLFGCMREKSLTVYIPDYVIDNLAVDAVSASVNIENLDVNTLSVDTTSGSANVVSVNSDRMSFDMVSGRLTVENSSAGKLTADEVSGSITISGGFGQVICDSVSGSVSVSPGDDLAEMKIDTVSGKVTVKLPEEKGFTAKYDSVSGSFSCEMEAIAGKNSVTRGDGAASINIDTVSGNIQIEKDE
jgi:DUF4097 and DUF4098 domain-containing protein YvlB